MCQVHQDTPLDDGNVIEQRQGSFNRFEIRGRLIKIVIDANASGRMLHLATAMLSRDRGCPSNYSNAAEARLRMETTSCPGTPSIVSQNKPRSGHGFGFGFQKYSIPLSFAYSPQPLYLIRCPILTFGFASLVCAQLALWLVSVRAANVISTGIKSHHLSPQSPR